MRNFIHNTIEVACSPDFQTLRGLEPDRSNMVKREQLIGGVDATLLLGTNVRASGRFSPPFTSRFVVAVARFNSTFSPLRK
jgi:hypothetical protein